MGAAAGLDPVLFGDYQQLKRFFYLFLFRDSLTRAVEVVAADEMAFLDQLWQDWSPGYDAAEVLARAKESLRQPANLTAAISYYRDAAVVAQPDEAEQAAGHPADAVPARQRRRLHRRRARRGTPSGCCPPAHT